MKRFYANAIFFALLFFAIVICFDFISMRGYFGVLLADWTNSSDYFGGGPDEIRPYIEKAQMQDGTTKLIIGDSICHQMFNGLQEDNADFTIIGSNGAITMAGQYILAKEYMDNHTSVTDVFLILLPVSFERTFDNCWGYQYTVMPFVETDTLKDLDPNTLSILEKTYGRIFLDRRIVRALYTSAINRKLYLNTLAKLTQGYSMPNRFELADQYVVKIAEMCEARGARFHLYPGPVSEKMRESVEDMREAFEHSKVCHINPDFFDMIQYYPAEQSADDTHFSGDYRHQYVYNEKIEELYAGSTLLEYLQLD